MTEQPNERLANSLAYDKRRKIERSQGVGFVYIVRCQHFIKIGVASDPSARVIQMQIGCPFKLHLVRYFPSLNPYKDERELHDLMGRHHERGEWFKLTKAMKRLLATWGK